MHCLSGAGPLGQIRIGVRLWGRIGASVGRFTRRLTNRDNFTICVLAYGGGNAPHQHAFHTGSAVRPHDDAIHFASVGKSNQLIHNVAAKVMLLVVDVVDSWLPLLKKLLVFVQFFYVRGRPG